MNNKAWTRLARVCKSGFIKGKKWDWKSLIETQHNLVKLRVKHCKLKIHIYVLVSIYTKCDKNRPTELAGYEVHYKLLLNFLHQL